MLCSALSSTVRKSENWDEATSHSQDSLSAEHKPALSIVPLVLVASLQRASFILSLSRKFCVHWWAHSFVFPHFLTNDKLLQGLTVCCWHGFTELCTRLIFSPLTLFFFFPFLLTFGQDNLCSPSDILQLNLSVKRTVETLLSLGAHAEESSFVCVSVQLLGFVAFYCALMLTLCVLYYRVFPYSWPHSRRLPPPSCAWRRFVSQSELLTPACFSESNLRRGIVCPMSRGAEHCMEALKPAAREGQHSLSWSLASHLPCGLVSRLGKVRRIC